jgi:hypothetical protein
MKIEWRGKEVREKIKNIVQAVSRDGAVLIAKHTRQAIPWDTGVLATSVEVRKSKFKDGGYMVVVQGKGNYEHYYASFVELGGHSSEWGRYVKGQKAGAYIAPKPYLRPSMHKNKHKIHRMYKDALL